MIIVAFMCFFVGIAFLGYSFYLAIKLYLLIDPQKEKYIRFMPFLVFFKSSYLTEGKELLLKFYSVFAVAIILLSITLLSGVFNN